MLFKFKTIYNEVLIPCIPDEVNNLIYSFPLNPSLCPYPPVPIGRIRHRMDQGFLPVLPVFQYTNKLDVANREIYTGHIVLLNNQFNKDESLMIIYSEEYGDFRGIFLGGKCHEEACSLMYSNIDMKIIRHRGLK